MNKGMRITFNSQFEKANGTWEIYNMNAENLYLGRVLKNGKLGKPNAENLLCLDRGIVNLAFFTGTATQAN